MQKFVQSLWMFLVEPELIFDRIGRIIVTYKKINILF